MLLGPDTLVAPIDPFPGGDPNRKTNFHRERNVWIPPGTWIVRVLTVLPLIALVTTSLRKTKDCLPIKPTSFYNRLQKRLLVLCCIL